MQILNISTTVRPSDSLSTRMFPVLTHESAVYRLVNPTVLIRDLVYDQNHEVFTAYNITSLKVVLRDPLIDLTDPDVLMARYNVNQTTVKLTSVLVDAKFNEPMQSVLYTSTLPTVKLHTVVVDHSQSKSLAAARFTVLGASAKLT